MVWTLTFSSRIMPTVSSHPELSKAKLFGNFGRSPRKVDEQLLESAVVLVPKLR
jgi:hypothetical protein